MKKILSLIFAVALIFVSCACSTSIDENVISYESDNADDVKKAEDVFDIDDTGDEIEDELEEAAESENKAQPKNEFETNTELNLFDTMNGGEKRELNVFLSNFSEAFYGLNDDNIAEDKISFAYLHNGLNNKSFKLLYKEFNGMTMEGISAELVDSTLIRFFGETVAHETPVGSEWWEYGDGYFWVPAASGETYHRFSVAKNMYKNSDGTYMVEFRTYRDDEDPHGPQNQEWYTETVESAESNGNYVFLYDGTAVLKEKVYNGSDTYEIVSYNVNN